MCMQRTVGHQLFAPKIIQSDIDRLASFHIMSKDCTTVDGVMFKPNDGNRQRYFTCNGRGKFSVKCESLLEWRTDITFCYKIPNTCTDICAANMQWSPSSLVVYAPHFSATAIV